MVMSWKISPIAGPNTARAAIMQTVAITSTQHAMSTINSTINHGAIFLGSASARSVS